jgi:HEAT repeat protein
MRVRLAALIGLVGFLASARAGDPATPLPGIVFVGAPIFDDKTDGGQGVYQGSYHWRDGYIYARSATYHRAERTMGPVRPGRNLYALSPAQPDGKLTRLTHLKTGAVFKPEPSFDGRKVLFAMRRDGEDWFHLYEVHVDGTGLRQLTDGPFNDFAGTYLPDGRIVFCSDRTGYLEEYHEERTETLFMMQGDGSGIRQLTFMPGTYFEPSVLRDGRIMFSFWDAFHIDVPPFDKHETVLMTVNPDGTEERHLFGSGQYAFFNRERHSGVGLTQAREMPDGRILVQSEMGPAILDLRAGLSVRDALTPIFPGTTSIQLGGTTHRSHLSPLGTRSTPYPLQDGRFLFSATLPGARDSGIYVCDPQTRSEELVINIPNYAEFDAVPVLVRRPKPAQLPARKYPKSNMARFLVVGGRVSDNPEREKALQRARFFRVIEAEYTGVTTSSHTNLETRILGVVPILPDGSAYFEAPADTPIFLDPVDAGGNRILFKWNYPNTSVAMGTYYPATQMTYMAGRAGETRSCYGCHASQIDAVPNLSVQAVKFGPVRITRESTDMQYRRNEPEAYRRQARLDEIDKYRRWLAGNPAQHARACEMLMYIEDGAERDVPVMAGFLKDPALDVRRAAALALTRLGTSRERDALLQAQQDADWQVRLFAEAAVAAIDGKDGNLFESLGRQPASASALAEIHKELSRPLPDVLAIRAAGKLHDAGAVPLLIPWLKRHAFEYHAAEAAVALGRIGGPEATAALWQALRSEVPIRQVHISRYLQHGPRPEEYALVKGLVLAGAHVPVEDLYLLLALLPNTFTEKPRFEDRMRDETQRITMPRLLLDRNGLRRRVVHVLLDALRGEHNTSDKVYQAILKGINLERPFSEHGRPFNVVHKIGSEESLWLLDGLLRPEADLPTAKDRANLEARVATFLTSASPRERIDAAVLLGRIGFGANTARILMAEIRKPYAFPEITSIGKGMPDFRHRDKAYLVQTLAQHIDDVRELIPFADAKTMFRDIRYGLTHGLARRGKADAIPFLVQMATRDPITLVRQQARYALADIQDAYRLAARPEPKVELPGPQPLETIYPPRGLQWPDTSFTELPAPVAEPPADVPQLLKYVDACLAPPHFRNLNNAQAAGAEHMMIAHVEETRRAFAALARHSDMQSYQKLLSALDSPYPFAHYLAAKALADRRETRAIPRLIEKLQAYATARDTVGFWSCCNALAGLKAVQAVPALARFATADNPPGTFGPKGMAFGYAAALALGRITADAKNPDVAPLLAGTNLWLRAGVLRGLRESGAPGLDELLRQAAEETSPALVRAEAHKN